jgi:hypothetical protein
MSFYRLLFDGVHLPKKRESMRFHSLFVRMNARDMALEAGRFEI